MRRRNYIGLLSAGGLSSLAGCNAQEGESSENSAAANQTQTSNSTENTATPEPPSFETTDLTTGSANMGEDIQIRIEIKNTGGQAGTWEAEYAAAVTNGQEPQEYTTSTVSQYVPANETRVWTSGSASYEDPVVIFYQINDSEVKTIDIPEARSPIIQETNLVSDWNSFGDAVDNSISEVEVGGTVNIASRYWYWTESQSLDNFVQVRVYDEADERVDIRTNSNQQVTEYSGWLEWETYSSFDSTEWGEGAYLAEVLIRDEQNEKVSNAGRVRFELI